MQPVCTQCEFTQQRTVHCLVCGQCAISRKIILISNCMAWLRLKSCVVLRNARSQQHGRDCKYVHPLAAELSEFYGCRSRPGNYGMMQAKRHIMLNWAQSRIFGLADYYSKRWLLKTISHQNLRCRKTGGRHWLHGHLHRHWSWNMP